MSEENNKIKAETASDSAIAAKQPKPKRFDEFLGQQKLLIEKLDVITEKFDSGKKKDFWDVLSSLSGVFTFLSSLVIAGLGVYFTDQYRRQDVRIAQAQAIEKFLPLLSNNDESLKRSALLTVSALQDKEFATRLASSYASNGTIDALEVILKDANDGDSKELLKDSLVVAYRNRALDTFEGNSVSYEIIITDFNRILELRNDDYIKVKWGVWFLANIYTERGNVYREKADYVNADKDYEKALQITPNYYYPLMHKAVMYMYKSEYDTALYFHGKSIESLNNCGECYIRRGETYVKQNQIDKAILDFDNAVDTNPNNDFFYSKRGYFYKKQKNEQKAKENFSRVLELTKNQSTREQAETELKLLDPTFKEVKNKEALPPIPPNR